MDFHVMKLKSKYNQISPSPDGSGILLRLFTTAPAA